MFGRLKLGRCSLALFLSPFSSITHVIPRFRLVSDPSLTIRQKLRTAEARVSTRESNETRSDDRAEEKGEKKGRGEEKARRRRRFLRTNMQMRVQMRGVCRKSGFLAGHWDREGRGRDVSRFCDSLVLLSDPEIGAN